jgi:hypothetical protein
VTRINKFFAGVVDTGDTFICEYLCKFSKIFKTASMEKILGGLGDIDS